MKVNYVTFSKRGDWYTTLKDKVREQREIFRRSNVQLPHDFCSIRIPEVKIADAFIIDSKFIFRPYNIKMKLDGYDPSLLLGSTENPEHFCELIKGKTLKKLVATVYVDTEGFYLETDLLKIKKALK